jgi:hypothetical protein
MTRRKVLRSGSQPDPIGLPGGRGLVGAIEVEVTSEQGSLHQTVVLLDWSHRASIRGPVKFPISLGFRRSRQRASELIPSLDVILDVDHVLVEYLIVGGIGLDSKGRAVEDVDATAVHEGCKVL